MPWSRRDVEAARRAIADHYAYAEERLYGRTKTPVPASRET